MSDSKIRRPDLMRRSIPDNSTWNLERKMHPSDVDLVFDFAGHFVFCEFKYDVAEWCRIPKGQWILYNNLLNCREHNAIAVLCKHIERGQDFFDSAKDVDSFQLMVSIEGGCETGKVWPGRKWQDFVEWYGIKPHEKINWVKQHIVDGTA